MAWTDLFSSSNSAPDLGTFNYNTEAEKLKRRRAVAQQLMVNSQVPRGQIVPGGPNGFYVAPSGLSVLGSLLSTYLGKRAVDKTDTEQTGLDKTAQAALAYHLQHLGDGTPAPYSAARDSQAANLSDVPQAGEQVNPTGAVPIPLPSNGPVDFQPLPPSPVQSISPSARAAAKFMSGGGGQFNGHGASGSWDDEPAPSPVLPPLGPRTLPFPPGSIEQPAAPPAPTSPMPPLAPAINPIAAANPGTHQMTPPSTEQQIARLTALANTGPQGEQVANMLLAQLGGKNADYKVELNRDPQTGELSVVRYNARTGHVDVLGGGVPGNDKVLETQQTPQGVMERTARGWRLAVGPDGRPLVTNAVAADRRADTDQQLKVGSAALANQSAQSSIDSSLARLDRIEKLFHETATGPLAGHLPNWTAARQELHALLAQDIFAETRDAVAGAADAGGAPRMAQSEFKYMANNGGLSQTTDANAAHNLIAQQKMRLLALKKSLAAHAETLNAAAPAPDAVPRRGQPVSASSYGF